MDAAAWRFPIHDTVPPTVGARSVGSEEYRWIYGMDVVWSRYPEHPGDAPTLMPPLQSGGMEW